MKRWKGEKERGKVEMGGLYHKFPDEGSWGTFKSTLVAQPQS